MAKDALRGCKRILFALLLVSTTTGRAATAAEQIPIDDRPIQGTVLDGGGQPVEGATVVVGFFREGEPQRQVVTTDAAGHFETKFRYGDGPQIAAYKPGLSVATHWVHETIKESGDVTLVLVKPAPFVARILDPNGQPVPRSKLRVESYVFLNPNQPRSYFGVDQRLVNGTQIDQAFTAESDPQGLVRIAAIPAGTECMVKVTAPGMGLFRSMSRRESRFYSGTEDKPAVITLQPEARIEGRVVTKLPGVNVEGLSVLLQNSNNSGVIADPYQVKTDADGRFQFTGLTAGTSNVFLYDHEPDGPWTYAAAKDTVTRPGETTQIEIELIEGQMVEGLVADPDGNPIAEAYVGVYGPIRPRSGAAIIGFRTKADGKYRFHLPPGEAYIYLSGPAPGYVGRGGGKVQVPAGKGTLDGPNFTLRPTREVVLRFLRPNGEPASDVEIIRLGNEQEFVDLKSRPLRPELDGTILLRRDNPLSFATGRRMMLTIRKQDGTEMQKTIELPQAAEIEITVP